MILKTAGALLFLGRRHAYKCFYGPGARQRLEQEWSNQVRARACPVWGEHVVGIDRISRRILRSARGRALAGLPDGSALARAFVEARLAEASINRSPAALIDLLDRTGVEGLLGRAEYRAAMINIHDGLRGAFLPGGPAHGDLHPGNIVLVDGGPQVIDCDRYSRASAPIFDRIHFDLAERRGESGGRWFDVMLENEDVAHAALRADGIDSASAGQTLLVYGLNRLAADARDRGVRRRSSRKYARLAGKLIERFGLRHRPAPRPAPPRRLPGANLLRGNPALRRTLLRALWWAGRISGDKVERALLRIINPDRKRFLPPGISASAFFARLDARHIDYVLLRWSQDLLHLDATPDLDILVSDRCVSAAFRELSLWPIDRPVDLYSESGISGTTYCARLGDGERRHIPVFPPDRSTHMLTHRVRRDDLCFVPCPEDQLWSLAYHVAYLKGAASGVALRSVEEAPAPGKHDYAATLREHAVAVGVRLDGDITRVRLAELLDRNGWHAPGLLVEDLASQPAA